MLGCEKAGATGGFIAVFDMVDEPVGGKLHGLEETWEVKKAMEMIPERSEEGQPNFVAFISGD